MVDNDLQNKIATGQRIRDLRKNKGMTLSDLAEALHVSPSTISRYESGETQKIPLATLKAIAETLGIDYRYLSGETSPDVPDAPAITIITDPSKAVESPQNMYLKTYRQSAISNIITDLRKNPDGRFVMIVEDYSMSPRILPEDRLIVKNCNYLFPGKVNVFLTKDNRITMGDVFIYENYENVLFIKKRNGEIIGIESDDHTASPVKDVIGFCEQLQTKQI